MESLKQHQQFQQRPVDFEQFMAKIPQDQRHMYLPGESRRGSQYKPHEENYSALWDKFHQENHMQQQNPFRMNNFRNQRSNGVFG